jgi:hypothetical protein
MSDDKVGDFLCVIEAYEIFILIVFSHNVRHERCSGSSFYAGVDLSASSESLAHGFEVTE